MPDNKENILVTITARGGSKGVKNKNIRELAGVPLIGHTIMQAKRWGRADKIACSTDSEEIALVAQKYGAEILCMRPAELATDTAGKIDVLKHLVRFVEDQDKRHYHVIVDLDPTAPIRKNEDLEGALRLFLDKRPKSVFSVTPCKKNPYFNMVEMDNSGFAVVSKKPASPVLSRQTAPKVYDMNASIYVYQRDYLLNDKTRSALSDRSLIWVMDEISAFDIDRESDFQFIEFLIAKDLVRFEY